MTIINLHKKSTFIQNISIISIYWITTILNISLAIPKNCIPNIELSNNPSTSASIPLEYMSEILVLLMIGALLPFINKLPWQKLTFTLIHTSLILAKYWKYLRLNSGYYIHLNILIYWIFPTLFLTFLPLFINLAIITSGKAEKVNEEMRNK